MTYRWELCLFFRPCKAFLRNNPSVTAAPASLYTREAWDSGTFIESEDGLEVLCGRAIYIFCPYIKAFASLFEGKAAMFVRERNKEKPPARVSPLLRLRRKIHELFKKSSAKTSTNGIF